MQTLAEVALGLFHELPREEHVRGGPVARDVVLRGGCARDDGGRRVLNLHFVQEDLPVLREFDLSGATNQHLHGAPWAKVGLEDVLKAAGRRDAHRQCMLLAQHIGLGVEMFQGVLGRHCSLRKANQCVRGE